MWAGGTEEQELGGIVYPIEVIHASVFLDEIQVSLTWIYLNNVGGTFRVNWIKHTVLHQFSMQAESFIRGTWFFAL